MRSSIEKKNLIVADLLAENDKLRDKLKLLGSEEGFEEEEEGGRDQSFGEGGFYEGEEGFNEE